MAELVIDLQEGFHLDSVLIEIADREVYRKEPVSTRNQIGLADSVRVKANDGLVNVAVRVPTKNVIKTLDVDASTPAFVGVSLVDDRELRLKVSRVPFEYL